MVTMDKKEKSRNHFGFGIVQGIGYLCIAWICRFKRR